MKLNILHKTAATIGLLTIVVLLTGCPFSSSVPVDEGTVKISDKLAGEWVSAADKGTANPTYFIISVDDKFHATAKKREFSPSDSTYSETIFHLTFSDVNGETFMNALENESTTYSILKFTFDEKNGEASTSEVSDYIKETFTTSQDLKTFIAKNKSNSYFYTNTIEKYVRK